jgi:hypothetical protein
MVAAVEACDDEGNALFGHLAAASGLLSPDMSTAASIPELCVTHLVWRPLGLDVFAAFVESYRARSAGIRHQLAVLFKGFPSDEELVPFNDLLVETPHRSVRVGDEGFDIEHYFAAARTLPHKYLCFLNSYSRIVDEDWLAKLHAQLTQPGVGLVGATGSHESSLDGHRQHVTAVRYPRNARGLAARFRDHRLTRRLEREFEPFPNPHIRTNGFMIERAMMLRLRFDGENDKMDSLRFESGKCGMTRQFLGLGLKALVVGSDGMGYESDHWAESRTFRSGEQENLLIADNRTDQYAAGDHAVRAFLRDLAWGR